MSLDNPSPCDEPIDSVGTIWGFFGGSGTVRIRYFGIGNGGVADANIFRSGIFGPEKRTYRRHTIFGLINSAPSLTVRYRIGNVIVPELTLVLPTLIFAFVETNLLFGIVREPPFTVHRGEMDFLVAPGNGGFLLLVTSLLMDVLKL